VEEKLDENAAKMGAKLMSGLKDLSKQYPLIQTVRGKGWN
jgi:4-aminobutyrate aminotransferase-like enzyme